MITLCFVATRPDGTSATAAVVVALFHCNLDLRNIFFAPSFRPRNTRDVYSTAVALLPLVRSQHAHLSVTSFYCLQQRQPASIWLVLLLPSVVTELTGPEERLPRPRGSGPSTEVENSKIRPGDFPVYSVIISGNQFCCAGFSGVKWTCRNPTREKNRGARTSGVFFRAGEPFWCTNLRPQRVSGRRHGRDACLSCAPDFSHGSLFSLQRCAAVPGFVTVPGRSTGGL